MRLITVLLLMSSISFAQQNAVFKSIKVIPTALPAKCVPGNIRVVSGGDVLSVCNPVNTWNAVLSAAVGTTYSGGDIVYSTASGLALLTPGTAGQVLTTNGANPPFWGKGAFWGGYHEGCDWNSTSNTYIELPNQSCAFGTRVTQNFPAVTTWGATQMGIQFTAPSADVVYQICANFNGGNDTAGAVTNFKLTDQSVTKLAETYIRTILTGAGTNQVPTTLCGFYVTPGNQTVSFRIWSKATAGTLHAGSGGAGIDGIDWSVQQVGP